MSHKHGAHIGGIRTLDDLRSRCYVDSASGCWHWRGWIDRRGRTGASYVMPCGTLRKQTVRRAGIELQRGEVLPRSIVVWARPVCHSSDCCNPAHSRRGTRAEWGRSLAGTEAVRMDAAKIARSTLASRARGKLTMERAREIRASELPAAEVARAYGVCTSTVSQVRAGAIWREGAVSAFGRAA